MNREILFRGKRVDNGEWVVGGLVHQTLFYGDADDCYHIVLPGEFHCDYYDSAEVCPDTVGQYTSLTDKNGKKIFEGDIFRYQPEDPALFVGVVKFGEFSPDGGAIHSTNVGFYVQWDDFDGKRCYLRKDIGFWVKFRACEVIGNIHDNPELLDQ